MKEGIFLVVDGHRHEKPAQRNGQQPISYESLCKSLLETNEDDPLQQGDALKTQVNGILEIVRNFQEEVPEELFAGGLLHLYRRLESIRTSN